MARKLAVKLEMGDDSGKLSSIYLKNILQLLPACCVNSCREVSARVDYSICVWRRILPRKNFAELSHRMVIPINVHRLICNDDRALAF